MTIQDVRSLAYRGEGKFVEFKRKVEYPEKIIREMVAFAVLFAATLIVSAMANYLIGEVVKRTGLSGTDRLFGMLFGLLRGFIVVMALLLLLPPLVPINQEVWWRESLLIPHFMSMEGWCRSIASSVIEFFQNLF